MGSVFQILFKLFLGFAKNSKCNQMKYFCEKNYFKFLQIIFWSRKKKPNQIKSNFVDLKIYFKSLQIFFGLRKQIKSKQVKFCYEKIESNLFKLIFQFNKTFQIKSNQILFHKFVMTNTNKLIWFDLIWAHFRPFQIICPGLATSCQQA